MKPREQPIIPRQSENYRRFNGSDGSKTREVDPSNSTESTGTSVTTGSVESSRMCVRMPRRRSPRCQLAEVGKRRLHIGVRKKGILIHGRKHQG